MNSAGDTCELLEQVQYKINQSFSSLNNDDSLCNYDLLKTVRNFKLLKQNGQALGLLFVDCNNNLHMCPCIIKLVTSIDKKFPKDVKGGPFMCAKVQYALYEALQDRHRSNYLKNRITKFEANCKDCYLMAIDAIYNSDKICLK